ncbi:MAG TPA: HD domain-containing phosphohydrolase [Pirellulales bacterium]|nr:HD domain-containing phosphohydrolase [Pirellulales bacterium]
MKLQNVMIEPMLPALDEHSAMGMPAQVPVVTSLSKRDAALRTSKILIVDDESTNVKVVEKYLKLEGYQNFVTTTDSQQALALVESETPDLLLLDIMMPHVSGLDILSALRADRRWTHLPIVILTASNDQATKRTALDQGATDFLGKPIDPIELIPRINNALTVKRHYDHLQRYSQELEAEVTRRTAELERSRWEVTQCLARIAEFREESSGKHVLRVGRYARLIARELGWNGDALEMLEQAALLHDIGKIGIPDSILLKSSELTARDVKGIVKDGGPAKWFIRKLSDQDLSKLCDHTRLGAELLKRTKSPVLAMAATIALSHHERWDGSGYPLGLRGDEIPIEGRITALADVFDTLSMQSSPPHSADQCFAMLEEAAGKAFDPQVVDALLRCRQEVLFTQLQFGGEK